MSNIVDLIIVLLFLFISVALFIGSCIIQHNIKKGCSVKIEAVIEDNSKHHNYSSHHSYHIGVYGYNYNGTHYSASAKSRWGEKEIGSQQVIFIDPSNPQRYYRKEDILFPRIMFWVSIAMTCISMINVFRLIIDMLFSF